MSSAVSVTKEDVGEVLAQCTCTSLDSALSFLSRKNFIGIVKLPEIKKTAKFLRDRGFNINLYSNKPELEEQLFTVFAQLPYRGGSSSVPTPAVSSSAGTTKVSSQTTPMAQSVVPLHAVPSAPKPQPQPLPKPAGDQQSSTTFPPSTSSSGQYSGSIAARLKDLNSKKRRVFDEAVAIPGMTANEILDALRFINTADCCVDAVVDSVVMKRSAACDPRDDANIAALERSLYDRAVMESEKERDNIQQRKRQKIHDLKNDIQSEIFSYEEFAASVLLRGLPLAGAASLPTSTSSASSSSGSSRLTTDQRCLHGSALIRALVLLFDYVAADSKSLELCELISAPIGGLRVTLVEVLLLERDALKFYKDACYAYLLSLIHTLDAVAEPAFERSFVDELFRVGSVKALTSAKWRRLFAGLSSRCEQVSAILTSIKDSFQRGMVKIPRDGGLIPELFRAKSLVAYVKMLRSNVEADGIEIADEDFGLLSERESLADDDDDDFDDDDDY